MLESTWDSAKGTGAKGARGVGRWRVHCAALGDCRPNTLLGATEAPTGTDSLPFWCAVPSQRSPGLLLAFAVVKVGIPDG